MKVGRWRNSGGVRIRRVDMNVDVGIKNKKKKREDIFFFQAEDGIRDVRT